MNGNSAHCQNTQPCEQPWSFTCEGPIMVICNEEGIEHIIDCARSTASGTCTHPETSANCGGVWISL